MNGLPGGLTHFLTKTIFWWIQIAKVSMCTYIVYQFIIFIIKSNLPKYQTQSTRLNLIVQLESFDTRALFQQSPLIHS